MAISPTTPKRAQSKLDPTDPTFERRKSPWTDYTDHNTIRDGDRVRHPSGEEGVVVYCPGLGASPNSYGNAWQVVYADGKMAPLQWQLGEEGQLEVMGRTTTPRPGRQLKDPDED